MSSTRSTTALLSDRASFPQQQQQPEVELVELKDVHHDRPNATAEQVFSTRTRSDTLEPLEDTGSRAHGLSLQQPSTTTSQSSPALPAPQPSHVPAHTSNATDFNIPESPRRLESQSTVLKVSSRARLQQLWFQWSTAYRIIIGLILTVNVTYLAYIARQNLSSPSLLIATSTNLLVAVLVRQEDLINASFYLVAKIPCTWPLSIRKVIADLHHYGGVHIGCAISSLVWYCVFVAHNTITSLHHVKSSSMTAWLWIDIVTTYAFMLCLLLVCITAHPRLRSLFHNTFEHTHRFGGWTALLVLWINTGVASRTPSNTTTPLYKTTPLYLVVLTTLLIILPWLRIRRITITAHPISTRELQLTFPHPNMPYTATVKFTRHPLSEWHAFATQPNPTASTASILVSQAGDWTTALLASPPSHLWIRNPPTQNFLACAPLFASLLVVATGAGIGPVLSLLASPAIRSMRARRKLVRVMWVVYEPLAPHWRFVLDVIRAVDPVPAVFDTRVRRPDVAREAVGLARAEGLEAVMVVSNPGVTRAVVGAVKAGGGAAYGAVFDS